ncbi:MAG: polysaccharide deacetylase family protein [Bacteroidales bacterium]|nr:polysaccharide deacetylase family protein [Bacteroidales bacterium]
MEELLIYVPKKTSRVRYVFRLVFRDLLNFPYRLITNTDEFESADQPKMIYGERAHSDDLFFRSCGLLFSRGVESIDLEPFDFDGEQAFFPVYDKTSVIPFDVFAAVFYLVSRYEEYQPFVRDEHGRFTAHLSISAQLGVLEKPLVNIWALMVKKKLQEKMPALKFPERKYRFVPTYDIDSAFAYAQKGLVRSLGGYFLAAKAMNWNDIAQRTRVLIGKQQDPFNTFDLQIGYQKEYGLWPIYFILFGRYSQYDKNINIRNRYFRFLVKRLNDYARIGIHPSYNTVDQPELLAFEIGNLEKVINKDVSCSRQHFLRLILPGTYRNLIEQDITDDYSMGYAALPGFRAGICSPFNFYDLDLETETKLRIHPFAVMDGTLRDYLELTPADAIEQIRVLVDEVKKVKGTFVSLWHNESLSDEKRWKGWRRVYEELLKMAIP